MMKQRYGLFVLLVCIPSSHTYAETKLTENTLRIDGTSKPSKASLKDVSWLTGNWTGTGLGATCHESWGFPHAGSMLGTFTFEKDNKVSFTEFFMLCEEQGTLVLKLKHFGADMKGWETKDKFLTFRLIKVQGNTAWFDGLTYGLTADGNLNVFLAMESNSGHKEAKFVFKPELAKAK